ncbi:conjugal transfer protein TraX [Spirochaetia bacterium]|nr:conjugal transfer protein TraX [Spirochaetia bacterium]
MELSKENSLNGITSNEIKLIAIIAMTIDHCAWTFFPGFRTDWPIILHIIGRITAPIMFYFIAEGCRYTKNIKKYIFRLFILAIVSHFAYKLLLTPGNLNNINSNIPFYYNFIPFKTGIFDQTSVIWAYLLGAIALAIDTEKIHIQKGWLKHIIIALCFFGAFIADWSSPAALAVFFIGKNHGNFKRQVLWLMGLITTYVIVYILFINVIYGIIQFFVCLAIPILNKYNGERGKWKGMKWFFYIYYPLHLTILGIIGKYINGM